jgi:biopolymer transport protein TolR
MATAARYSWQWEDDDASLVQRRRPQEDVQLDLAPMIDMTFLLLIFFLVCTLPEMHQAADLPPARHGVAVAEPQAVVITIADRGDGHALVYLDELGDSAPLTGDPAAQQATVRAAVERGLRAGKTTVLVKAERGLRHGEVAQIAAAARVPGMRLALGVKEAD